MSTSYTVTRFSSQDDDTLGLLFRDGEFVCFTLEDEEREIKVAGETRIPFGLYDLEVRQFGGTHERYKNKFDFHEGMVEIKGVPNFTDILIHIGNTDEHTAGCLLVGDTAHENVTKPGTIGSSTSAYKRMYQVMIDDIVDGETTIRFMDLA